MATNNRHKFDEIQNMVSGKIKILKLSDITEITELPETSDTLEENALEKARFIYDNFNVNCFADDTGLEVEALDGRPGVYSARYAGPNCSAQDNMEKLLQEMQGIDNRKAIFRTVIVSIIDGHVSYHEGSVEGEITRELSGVKGFGYDPIFLPSGYNKTFAEMTMDEKNKISHRKRAITNFLLLFDLNNLV